MPPPPVTTDPRIPLANLTAVQTRLDSLSRHLSDSVNSNTILPPHEMDSISSELISAIHQVVINGASLIASQTQILSDPAPSIATRPANPVPGSDPLDDDDDLEIVEIDAEELLAEHIHVCEICGKGFKRDANLRMHMRAHGNQYKTPQALAKPDTSQFHSGSSNTQHRKTRFSCPYEGCNRNKHSVNFRALKSIICVKNHFKRSHCQKMYGCTRCNKKSFSVVADLKSHLRTCGEAKWKCSCGTGFTGKDKLFAHMALFDGHMPAIDAAAAAKGVFEVVAGGSCGGGMEFDELLEGFDGNMTIDEFFRF